MPSGFAVVLPARYHSTRFPGKPLALIGGKPLIEWVYRRAELVPDVSRIVVATDDDAIASTVRRFGGDVVMTSGHCRTGTDRVAEAARNLPFDPIVNLQGDEPIFPIGVVRDMVAVATNEPDTDIVTACHPIVDEGDLENPNVVKVVTDTTGRALYFSRAAIPYRCGETSGDEADPPGRGTTGLGLRHIGIYVFRRASLLRFSELPRTRLEILENLEQLRALEHGMTIRVVETAELSVGVDVPEDVKTVEKALGGE
jgi:3-deoxy-manno-octulosonate cytidylyltransferase (CMP-KDO synthetase)